MRRVLASQAMEEMEENYHELNEAASEAFWQEMREIAPHNFDFD